MKSNLAKKKYKKTGWNRYNGTIPIKIKQAWTCKEKIEPRLKVLNNIPKYLFVLRKIVIHYNDILIVYQYSCKK